MRQGMQESVLLIREASLSAMALGQGLTQIRKYDFSKTGFFYSSLLQLSTGLERILKLIIIYAHRLKFGKFPSNKELRGYGHNLTELFEKSLRIANEFGCDEIAEFYFKDEIYGKIISLLSDFAMQARYYNLDLLTGRNQKNSDEPLARWEKEINTEILKRHFRPRKSTLIKWGFVIDALEDYSFIFHTAEDGSEIDSFSDMAKQAMLVPTKQKYSMYYLYILIRYLSQLLQFLEEKGEFYPFLREFFMIFMVEKREEIIRKKSWNPFPPYKF